MKRRLRWAAWLLAAGMVLQAQLPGLRRFTGRDGLPQSQVCALMEDRNGFLWVGTFGGVARMGANGFQTFGRIPGLKGSRAWALLEDKEGAVWVAFQDGGLVRILGNRYRIFGKADGLEVSDTFSLAMDGQGRVLAGTRDGLFRQKGGGFERVALPDPWNHSPVFSMATEPGGEVWLGGGKGTLGCWDGKGIRMARLPAALHEGNVGSLQWDGTGRLWALASQALAVLEPDGQWRQVPVGTITPSLRLHGLSISPQGEILVGMGTDGVWQRDPDGTSRVLGADQGWPKEGVITARRDREGRLWVGSNGGGLSVLALPGLVNLSSALGSDLGDTLAFLEPRPGVVLIGGGRGLFRWEEGKGITRHWEQKDGLPGDEVWVLRPDGLGGVWVGTAKGFARLVGDRLRPAPPSSAHAIIHHLERMGSRLWAGTDRGLLELDLQGNLLKNHALPAEAVQNMVYSLLVSRLGLLVGTMQGVYLFQEGNYRKLWTDAPFANQRITEIFEDTGGKPWVATTKGLYHLGNGAWESRGMSAGLPDELIYFLGDAGEKRVAVGHGKGISILDGRHMLNVNQNLGLVADETNQGGYLLDSKGRMWIGMIGGIGRLDALALRQSAELRPPVVLEVSWAGARSGFQSFPSEVRIPPHTPSLEFRLDLGTPLLAFPPSVQVRIPEIEKEWRSVEGGYVQYGQLPPGNYRLETRSSFDGRTWALGEGIPLKVSAAWYEHILGRLLIVCLALGSILGAAALRVRRIQRSKLDLEQRIRERTSALAESERKAQDASKAKSIFLANMSHELRTPLNAILGFAQLMSRDAAQTAESRENLDRILRAGEHLLTLINDVLSISKIEAGKLSLSLRPFDSLRLLNGVAEMAEIRAQGKGIEFRMELDPALPKHAEGDEGKLRQVLLNLVGNALKFTEHGHVVLRVGYAMSRAWFEVEDTGPGIRTEDLKDLFGAFNQAEAGRAQVEGTGLGLHIGQAMVHLMGGEIQVKTELGRGSLFRFEIPLPAVERDAPRPAARRVVGLEPGQPRLKILLVDDREENRLLLSRFFGIFGFEVRGAEDGVEGLAEWEVWAPDVVWLDIRMPRMDGFETVERLRALETERGLPRTTVIALTASTFDHDYEAMLKAGFDHHVAKPFREADLYEALTRFRGVRFLYEVASDGPTPAPLTRERLAGIPMDVSRGLREAALQGDNVEAEQLLAKVEEVQLRQDLLLLVKSYRFEELAELFGE